MCEKTKLKIESKESNQTSMSHLKQMGIKLFDRIFNSYLLEIAMSVAIILMIGVMIIKSSLEDKQMKILALEDSLQIDFFESKAALLNLASSIDVPIENKQFQKDLLTYANWVFRDDDDNVTYADYEALSAWSHILSADLNPVYKINRAKAFKIIHKEKAFLTPLSGDFNTNTIDILHK